MIGKNAKKNIVELNEKEFKEWMSGIDIENKTKERYFVIIKYKNDFLGCGKATDKKILNYVPKARRLRIS